MQTEKRYLSEALNDKSCYQTSITLIPNLDALGPKSKTQIAFIYEWIYMCVKPQISIYKYITAFYIDSKVTCANKNVSKNE